ncbi:MAG: transketolase [Solirubrobacterales bacterium]|nr:transketolase [Solirubrobacterales bacterium]MBV9810778.1 transketolase [Solirubrobacterales bacterium]
MDAVQKANSGHPGTPMALAPVAYVLYARVMRHSPRHPDWPDRDRFVLSAGHASMLLYSTLYLAGYEVSLDDDIMQFRQLGSRAAGHPEYHDLPGIEVTTGPLGQGISHAVGMALAERMLAARFNRPGHEIVDHRTFVIASDGDLEEGISGEASSIAGHLGLGRLVSFYDQNHISIEGDTKLAFTEDVGKRYEAYGWHVQDLEEDVELDSLQRALENALAVDDKPSLIIVRTHIAQGSPHKQDTAGAHGSPLGEEEVKLTKQAMGWPSLEPFYVPEEALEHFRRCVERGEELEAEWRERFDRYAEEHPELAGELERMIARRLPEGWDSDVPRFHASGSMTATRKSSQTVLQWAAARVPELVGGSADLAPSTLTLIDGGGDVEAGSYEGRNLHFGIREHAMGAIVNGLTLHYFRGYGSTFFTFSDYMRGSVRLAALMKLPSIFLYTHDSIGLGEDGPTHQPIEHLAGLRAMPTLRVVRPAGANETGLAWHYAIKSTDHPTALVLSRQGIPTWNPAAVPADAIERGAYVLRYSYKEPEPDLILIASGTEVHICARTADALEAEGIATRLVSMPCMENFAAQDAAYRDRVLPPACRARVSVEAAATFGWHQWVGELGKAIGMETFGASGPAGALYKHFGLTPERVGEAGREVVKRVRGS